MVRRTTINLDVDLVSQAREILSTANTTDTVHGALRDVIRRERLRRLAEWDLGGMTLEDLQEMRRPRTETREWGRGSTGLDVLQLLRGTAGTGLAADDAESSRGSRAVG
jgi:Arc/MetJ family transcription regulator